MAVLKISASVGKGGKNKPDDVKKIQLKLNEHKSAGKYQALKPDGKFGKKTQAAIETFQLKVLAGKKDGIVNPGKSTLGGLNCKPGQVGGDDAGPKGKMKAGAKAGAKGGEDDDDDDKSDLFDLVVIRKLIRKVPQKDLLFAFASAGNPEDCKLVLKRKGNPKTLGMLVKKESGIPKVTWGIASQADDDRDTLVLDIMGKQLPGMEKKAKKLLKIQKLLPFKKVRLAKGGIEVEDLPEDEEATDERGSKKPQDEKAEISKKVQETLIKAPAIWQNTRRTIAKNITQLKNAIRKAFASEGRKAIADIDKDMKAIDGVLVMLDDRLGKSLANAGAAKDRRAFDAELKGTLATLKFYEKYAASDPLIKHIDANPFGVKTDLQKTITASLRNVQKTVENASKAA